MKQLALSLVMMTLVKVMPAQAQEQDIKKTETQIVVCQFKGHNYHVPVPVKLLPNKDKTRSFCRGWLKAGGEIQ